MKNITIKLNGEIEIKKKDETIEITLSPSQENEIKIDELVTELSNSLKR